jgi:hypothetical protein
MANAKANGDAPVNKQGFHFKLQFSQDPQKHKTFWVNCPAPSGSGGGTGGSGGGGGGNSGGTAGGTVGGTSAESVSTVAAPAALAQTGEPVAPAMAALLLGLLVLLGGAATLTRTARQGR